MISNSSSNNILNKNLNDFSEPLDRYSGKTFFINVALSTFTLRGNRLAYVLKKLSSNWSIDASTSKFVLKSFAAVTNHY